MALSGGLEGRVHRLPVAGRAETRPGEVAFLGWIAFWAMTLVALGLLIGATPVEQRPWRLAGFLVAEIVPLLLLRLRSGRVPAAIGAGAILAVAFAHDAGSLTPIVAYGVLLSAFMLESTALASDLLRLRALVGQRFGEAVHVEAGAPTLETLGRRELARARRYGRPLALASLSQGSKCPWFGTDVAARIAQEIRCTDILGIGEDDRIEILMPDTIAAGAEAVVRRALEAAGVGRSASVGIASFPEDEVTWGGLHELARARGGSVEDLDLEEICAPAL